MQNAEYFLSTRPALPLPVLGIAAILLVVLTLWAYLKHPLATKKRVSIILGLRLLALAFALLTAIRPSIGIQEDPKLPSFLLIGVDASESMTVKDEVDSQTRIEAVRKAIEKCQPTIEELQKEQNIAVKFYSLGDTNFTEATNQFTVDTTINLKKSDYGVYLNRTLERWKPERYIRGHIVIGDGADNGTAYNAVAEAARWRNVAPLHTVAIGRTDSPSNARDVSVRSISCDPEPVPIKTDLIIRAVVDQAGFPDVVCKAVLSFDVGDGNGFVEKKIERLKLDKATGNVVEFRLKAPEKAGEVKVKVEVPVDQLPGDVAPLNNIRQTYLTVTKDGIRVLYVDRWRNEMTRISDAWRIGKQVDVTRVLRQDDSPASAAEKAEFDFDNKAYDAIVIGNISAKQLQAIDPNLPEKIREQVVKKGVGLLFLGGESTLAGSSTIPGSGYRGSALEELCPVEFSNLPKAAAMADQEKTRFQTVLTAEGSKNYITMIADSVPESVKLWDQLNATDSITKLPGISKVGNAKPLATVLAYASNAHNPVKAGLPTYTDLPVLLAYQQTGEANRSRVVAFMGQDSYVWDGLGIRTDKAGVKLTNRFWRQMLLWLAHQEENDGLAFAKPQFRELPAGTDQTVRFGLRSLSGGEIKDAQFTVTMIPPGSTTGQTLPPIADANGGSNGGSKVDFKANLTGEYVVNVSAVGKDSKGAEIKADASTRFFAYPDVSDEMIRTAADYEFLKSLANSGAGQFLRLDDLQKFLNDFKTQPLSNAKPKPRYVPDWRRNQGKLFLPIWLILFVGVVGAEWALRRWWGLV